VPQPPAVLETINGGAWLYEESTEEIVVYGRKILNFRGYASWRYRYTP
jgi:hypothetical protein